MLFALYVLISVERFFKKLVKWEEHVFFRLGETRWLTMQYAVNLILEQYITLTEYFMLCETDSKINHDVILTAPQDPIT